MTLLSQSKKVYEVHRCTGPANLVAGRFGQASAWQQATLLQDFAFPWLDQRPPRTTFRSLWDNENLYFLFDFDDDDLVLSGSKDERERVLGSDRAEIFLTTGPDLQPYYCLEMEPRGDVLAFEGRYHRQFNWDWVCEGLRTSATQTRDGYIIEGSIPLATLVRLGCLHQDVQGRHLSVGLFRAEFSHTDDGNISEQWISWVNPQVDPPDFHVPSAFGTLLLSD